MPGIDKLEQEQGEATPASDQNIKNVLLQASSSLSNTATSTPAAKHHQMIIFMGRLLGWSHFDDLPSRLKTLPRMEQCMNVPSLSPYLESTPENPHANFMQTSPVDSAVLPVHVRPSFVLWALLPLQLGCIPSVDRKKYPLIQPWYNPLWLTELKAATN